MRVGTLFCSTFSSKRHFFAAINHYYQFSVRSEILASSERAYGISSLKISQNMTTYHWKNQVSNGIRVLRQNNL